MAHFVELDENNVVVRGIVVHNNELLDENNQESEQKGIDFCINLFGGKWVQTSYNTQGGVHTLGGTPLYKNYASAGYTFDGVGFAAPKPYDSWTLDAETYVWNAPTPYPSGDGIYQWNEETLNWQLVEGV